MIELEKTYACLEKTKGVCVKDVVNFLHNEVGQPYMVFSAFTPLDNRVGFYSVVVAQYSLLKGDVDIKQCFEQSFSDAYETSTDSFTLDSRIKILDFEYVQQISTQVIPDEFKSRKYAEGLTIVEFVPDLEQEREKYPGNNIIIPELATYRELETQLQK